MALDVYLEMGIGFSNLHNRLVHVGPTPMYVFRISKGNEISTYWVTNLIRRGGQAKLMLFTLDDLSFVASAVNFSRFCHSSLLSIQVSHPSFHNVCLSVFCLFICLTLSLSVSLSPSLSPTL